MTTGTMTARIAEVTSAIRTMMIRHPDTRADRHVTSRRRRAREGIRIGDLVADRGMTRMRRIMPRRGARTGMIETGTAIGTGTMIGVTGPRGITSVVRGIMMRGVIELMPGEIRNGRGRGGGRRRGVGGIMRMSMIGIGRGGGRGGRARGIGIGVGGGRRGWIPRRSWRRARIIGIRLSRLLDRFWGRWLKLTCASHSFCLWIMCTDL